jgi:hypothetical protein
MTYILYLTISHINEENETLFLGACEDPFDLYYFAFNTDNIELGEKWIQLEWLNKVETLSSEVKEQLKDRFSHPKDEGESFTIGRMTLYSKKIRKY